MKAVTLERDPTMIDPSAVDDFEASLRGPILKQGDPDYDDARSLYNGMIDKHPALIARCHDVADVMAAVDFARKRDLLMAVRGGGHNGPGLGSCDGGIVVDLSEMNGIHVDPSRRVARVEGGATWGEVDHATHGFGLATVSGIISTTGVGGLTLGGGHGYLTRRYGLTVDNLLSADIVLADGRFVTASEEENQDLFWALRGGGGNFGVVTSFEFQLHPVDTVIAGPTFWPLDEVAKTLRWYREWLPAAPEDIYAFYLVAEVPSAPPFPEAIQGEKVCGLMWCCTGSQAEAEGAVAESRQVAEPLFEHVGPMPYPALQTMHDDLYPTGLEWYWKGDFVKEIPDGAVAEHVRHGEVPTMHSTMHLYPVNGAAHDVPRDETAWSYRDAHWSMVIAGVDHDPSNRGRITEWARDYWKALHPYSAGGAYLNFMMEEGDDRVRATYRENHERLARIKKKYDPENRFRVNQNIPPGD
jgi:FAD/FMN-containing dehydrogenase